MSRVQIGKTLEGLNVLSAGIHQAAVLTLRGAVTAAEASAKATTLWKDDRPLTRSTIRGQVDGGLRGWVSAGGASRFLEYGTRPHTIHARAGGMLRFVVNGTVLYRRWVRHPGTKATGFMSEARLRGIAAAEYGAEYYLNFAISRAR